MPPTTRLPQLQLAPPSTDPIHCDARSPSGPTSAPTPTRRTLGPYALVERIGQGGMAEVWLARRCVMPDAIKPCAIKVIRARYGHEARYRRMFRREARLALKLRHANLVSVFDAGQIDDRLYMAMEWIDGVPLRRLQQALHAAREPFPVDVICHLAHELLQGLRYLHGLSIGGAPLGVVHRDIAPHNVLVSASGEVKLADFGIARVRGEASSGMYIKGRARYMAPEQLHGEATVASDLFAVGAIVHELLTGQRFRPQLEGQGQWHRIVAADTIPVLLRDDVPPALEALRAGLLQTDPQRRIASADEAIACLLQCPPWPTATVALRALYDRHVGAVRRSGLTRPPPSRVPTLPPAHLPLANPALPSPPIPLAPPQHPPRSQQAHGPVCPPPQTIPPVRPESPSPAPWLEGTATLARPTGTERTGPRIHARPRPRTDRVPRPELATLRRVGGGLWLVAGLFAMIATAMVLVPMRPIAAPHAPILHDRVNR